ncbi:MAG TPA: YraN family protein [Nocardioides sp.]|nr:YraN family protein [Nocardioides sp.]
MNRTDDPRPTSPSPPGAGRPSRPRALGAFGEAYAARHLVERGMVLLDRNWRCELGEIDLVLRDGDTLVFCEVKTRSSALYGSPLETVTARKAARLRRLAARWLTEHQLRPRDVRLDLVGVLVPRTGSPSVEHAAGVG